MLIIAAPQGFKGSMKAHEAAEAMLKGIKAFDSHIKVVSLPIADGGAGTVRALVLATNGKTFKEQVHGPLGESLTAVWGISGDKQTAFIEVAAASGLSLVPEDKRNPLHTTTLGTGELILKALEASCTRMIIGLGDSATTDGGLGVATALGLKFTDAKGRPVPPTGEGLGVLKHISVAGRNPLVDNCDIMAACDVTNPLYGTDGAAVVYGPQKGATPAMVKELDINLRNLADVVANDLGLDIANLPGAGAAGGLGFGLTAFLGARLERGVDLICDAIGFDALVKDADLVITGEGRIDFQTAFGKAAVGIAKRAKKYKKPVIAICGSLGQGYEEVYQHGIDAAMSILPRIMTLEEAMKEGPTLLKQATERAVRMWAAGRSE